MPLEQVAPLLMVLSIIIIGAVVMLVILAITSSLRSKKAEPRPMAPEVAPLVKDATYSTTERMASPVSEQIEEIARRRLAQYPDLAQVEFDFGTMHDGTIDVWVAGVQYDNPEDIPDERIRRAIREAVAQYNAS